MVFEKYAFIKEKVIDQDLFKVREETVKRPFVSDAFRETVINERSNPPAMLGRME